MFKGTITNTRFFKQFIESTKDLITDTNLNLTSNGINIKTLDDSAVSLCNIHFDVSDFQSLECTKEFTIGLSLSNLLVILKFSEEPITIEYNEENGDKLDIGFTNTDFEIKLMDIAAEDLEIPEFEYPCIYEYDSVLLNKSMASYTLISDNEIIITNKPSSKHKNAAADGDGSLFFHLKGDILNCVDNPTPKNIILSDKIIKTSYILKFINKFMKASFLSNTVKICVSDEYPLFIEFKKSETFIQYYLAPKIPDDE